jgi:hypothetical protein
MAGMERERSSGRAVVVIAIVVLVPILYVFSASRVVWLYHKGLEWAANAYPPLMPYVLRSYGVEPTQVSTPPPAPASTSAPSVPSSSANR